MSALCLYNSGLIVATPLQGGGEIFFQYFKVLIFMAFFYDYILYNLLQVVNKIEKRFKSNDMKFKVLSMAFLTLKKLLVAPISSLPTPHTVF